MGMLVVSLWGENYGFWYPLGYHQVSGLHERKLMALILR